MRFLRVAAIAMVAWILLGTALACPLGFLFGRWSDGFALGGLVLMLGAVGWALGPFKAPMVWSEGALMAYESNANPSTPPARYHGWRMAAAPVFALAAGTLLLGIAVALAVA